MIDALTGTYLLPCPARGSVKVRLSAFRLLERLPGAAHPSVYRVRFSCPCGGEHEGIVGHAELDWAPLGLEPGRTYVNLMTDREEDLASELADLALRRLEAGEWPWSFFCYLEERPRPVTPSAFRLIAPGHAGIGIAVRCPCCESQSINVVTEPHLDFPFWNDATVGVVEHVYRLGALASVDELRAELREARTDRRPLRLAA